MSPKFPRSFPTPVDYGYHPSWMDRSYVQQRKNHTFRYLQGKYDMQQSELARPWLNEGPYLEMEYDPLVPGWPRPSLFMPDGPWMGDPDLAEGYHVTFNAWTTDCYNDGETTEIEIKSTHPITSIAPGPTDSGYTISTVDAAAQIYSVTVDEGKTGFLYLRCTLTVPYGNDQGLPGGLTGRATASVSACSGIDCSACTIEWDDGISADTIARSSSATVGITPSDLECGPWEWSVSGTGFTLDNAQTTGLSNTLNADGTACGTATITVTDACENSVTGYVRCTTGVWDFLASYTHPGGTGYYLCNGVEGYDNEHCGSINETFIEDYKKWIITYNGPHCYDGVSSCSWNCATERIPPCGNRCECAQSFGSCGTESEKTCYCYSLEMNYYEWKCS